MSTWMRYGWAIVALGSAIGTSSTSVAGPFSSQAGSDRWTGWNPGRDLSLVSQSSAFSFWSHVSWTAFPLQATPHTTAPPGPIVPVSAPVQAPIVSVPTNPAPAPAPAPALTLAPVPAPQPVTAPVPAIIPAPVSSPPAPLSAPMPASSSALAVADAQVIPVAAASAAPAAAAAAPVSAAPVPQVNAFINLGSGPYPAASTIATGNPQPWYNSPGITGLYGGAPTAQQQADFASTVMQRVQQTFQLSGISISLTSDPTVAAAHTLSLVSNTSAQLLPSAIGMSYVGTNGFSFIDQEAKSAQTTDQLEWIVAHNLSHELMLTLGVGENYDQSGNYIDARNALWTMMTSPTATFSSAAAQAINQALTAAASAGSLQSAQVLANHPVPEPCTLALWAFGGLAVARRLVTRTSRR